MSRVVEHRIEESFGPEPDRIVRRQTGLLLGRRDRLPGLVRGHGGGVQRNRSHGIGDSVGSPSTTVRPTSWQSTYR